MLLTPGFIPTNACSGGMNPSFAIAAEAIADVKQIRQSARHVNLNVNKKRPTLCQISSMEDTVYEVQQEVQASIYQGPHVVTEKKIKMVFMRSPASGSYWSRMATDTNLRPEKGKGKVGGTPVYGKGQGFTEREVRILED